MLTLSAQLSIPNIATGPSDPALKQARVCYDHLAGEIVVNIHDSLKERHLILDYGEETVLTDGGRAFFTGLGFNFDATRNSKRQLCKSCLDWSERTNHLAGTLGKWILDDLFEKSIVKRHMDSRAISISKPGYKSLRRYTKYKCPLN